MLKRLKELREKGYPVEFLNRYAEYRIEYSSLPLSERERMDFGYFLRMKYIKFLRKRYENIGLKAERGLL